VIADGDISNLAGRLPLGQPDGPNEPQPLEDTDMEGRRWRPLWAAVFVCVAGLVSWGAIAAVVVNLVD
jgi:hypothetical protein